MTKTFLNFCLAILLFGAAACSADPVTTTGASEERAASAETTSADQVLSDSTDNDSAAASSSASLPDGMSCEDLNGHLGAINLGWQGMLGIGFAVDGGDEVTDADIEIIDDMVAGMPAALDALEPFADVEHLLGRVGDGIDDFRAKYAAYEARDWEAVAAIKVMPTTLNPVMDEVGC